MKDIAFEVQSNLLSRNIGSVDVLRETREVLLHSMKCRKLLIMINLTSTIDHPPRLQALGTGQD
jgi:hypothetical protein